MRFTIRSIALMLSLLFMSGFRPVQNPSALPKDVNISITKVDSVWKAVLTGTKITEIHVVPGQKVIFHAEGTDVFFQFDSDTLFGGHAKSIKNGKKLTLGVGKVQKGIHTYSAFCVGPQVYAEGDSPPKIIVD
jgi:hypothetical protein